MGGRESKRGGAAVMGDVSALEKQLNVKTKQIAELQAKLDDKARKVFGYKDALDNKMRGIYYLERSIQERNRTLTDLRRTAEGLQAKVSPDFAAKIDKAEDEIDAVNAENDALREQCEKVQVSVNQAKAIGDKYKSILAEVDAGMSADNIVEAMQSAIQQMEEQNGQDKQ